MDDLAIQPRRQMHPERSFLEQMTKLACREGRSRRVSENGIMHHHRLASSLILEVSGISAAQGPLIGEELALLEGATPSRQRELIAGRVLARRVMTEMGYAQAQITRQPCGAPVWPIGLCGSIAHSASHVVVAMATTSRLRSVGIDIEDGRNLGSAASEIGLADEIEALIPHPFAGDGEGAARLLFSAKEALYKCQSPLTGNTNLDFPEIRLEMTSEGLFKAYRRTYPRQDRSFQTQRHVDGRPSSAGL